MSDKGFIARIRSGGSSLRITIPYATCKLQGLSVGDFVEVQLTKVTIQVAIHIKKKSEE